MDSEVLSLVSFTEHHTKVPLETFLYHGGTLKCRVYLIQDHSLLKSSAMFSSHKKPRSEDRKGPSNQQTQTPMSEGTAAVVQALDSMEKELVRFVTTKFAGRKGTPRLGFTSDREIFNIFKKVFGDRLFDEAMPHSAARKIMEELNCCIKMFRDQSSAKVTSVQEINKLYPVYVLVAHMVFKMALFCQGKALYKTIGTPYPLGHHPPA